MTIKNGDFVVTFINGATGNEVAMKCRSIEFIDDYTVLAIDAYGNECAICVSPIKFNSEIGLEVTTIHGNDGIVALCGRKKSFISMAWMDEAASIYTANGSIYNDGINLFTDVVVQSQKYVSSCQAPKGSSANKGIEYLKYTGDPYPFEAPYNLDVFMENIGRDLDIPSTYLINTFNTLMTDFQNKDPIDIVQPDVIVLTVDNSGSMNTDTIDANDSFTNLKNHIITNYGYVEGDNLIITEYSDEKWLHIWANQLSGII